MSFDQVLSAFDISGSGMAAERLRMDVIAGNIASAEVTDGGDGKPFLRRRVHFQTILDRQAQALGLPDVKGVRVLRVDADRKTPLRQVYRPGDPRANPEGYVTMPNVNVAFEMVDMITTLRAYEANLRAIQVYREMALRTLGVTA